MRVFLDFGALVLFDCVFGVAVVEGDRFKIYVVKGLALPFMKDFFSEAGCNFVSCEQQESTSVERFFPVRYIYDPVRGSEYFDWAVEDELLRGKNKDGDWVYYSNKAESRFAMHEYVGGCWLVFDRISHVHEVLDAYEANSELVIGRFEKDYVSSATSMLVGDSYFVEGVCMNDGKAGWGAWNIMSGNFWLEIS